MMIRWTGLRRKGRVDAYTLEQLQQMRLLQNEERIPLFAEVLRTVAGRCSADCRAQERSAQ